MRLKRVVIEGFRAFSAPAEIDLDADVIVLQGPNGVGKTSLLDAILWCLTGAIQRFGERGSAVSLYAREGFARVALTLRDNLDDVEIIRSAGSGKHSLRIRSAGDDLDGPAADQRLCDLILPHLKDRVEGERALQSVLTRGVYLQQDLVRQFVENDSAIDRFALMSEVVGAGVVLEIQQWLERSRNMWSRSSSAKRRDELEPLEKRLLQIDDHVFRLSEGASEMGAVANARDVSNSIYQRAVELLGKGRLADHNPPETSSQLDRFLKELGAERTSTEREALAVSALIEQYQRLTPPDSAEAGEISALRAKEAELVDSLRWFEEALSVETKRLSDERELLMAAVGRADRRAALARLALEDMGPHCPVCEQAHDVEHTKRHLEALIAAVQGVVRDPTSSVRLDEISEGRADAREQLEHVRRKLSDYQERTSGIETRRLLVSARLRDLSVDASGDVVGQLNARRELALQLVASLDALIRDGEGFSLRVLRLGEQRRRDDLIKEREVVSAQIDGLKLRLGSQDRIHGVAGAVIDGLREASLAITQRQVEQIAPLFQRIYSRIDPHPTFRVTQIAASMRGGKGQLNLGIVDPDASAEPKDANPILSSSQLNSYAVSLFLAMNLALPTMKLGVTILDDPLQSLDSLNLLGLVDVLRRFRAHRQIIVSTHEDRLVGLLQRKLRPVREGERMITILFKDWNREGPNFSTLYAEHEPNEARVLAA